MKKRLSVLLLVFSIVVMSLCAASAESPSVKDLGYAYIVSEKNYLTIGKENTWHIEMSGNPSDYKYDWKLYIRKDLDDDQFEYVTGEKKEGEPTFAATVDTEAHYVLHVDIMSKDFYSTTLKSEMYLATNEADVNSPETVPGKVKQIVDECRAQNLSSDYDNALWLHDWLIFNADYDESKTIHEAAGVLLQGKGVCESYALAYQLLLGEIGIPSIYATGYAGGDLHAWNLIKLDDSWVYVDCTWDDPIGGGNEGYGYFGLSDKLLSRDHMWNADMSKLPKATTDEYNYLMRNGAKIFSTEEEMNTVLSAALEQKETPINYLYMGEKTAFGTYEITSWLKKNFSKHMVETYSVSGSRFSGKIELSYKDGEGYAFFTSDEEMESALKTAFTNKENPVKIMYRGEDQYYTIEYPIKKWLQNNYYKYFVNEYSYSYTSNTADISVTYGNFDDYSVFTTVEELNSILDAAKTEKKTELKLYYTGDDPYFMINSKISSYMLANSKEIVQYYGSVSSFYAEITVEYK